VTAGETSEEARELALEALCLHIEGMIQDGEPIPSPTPIERITTDPANRDAADVFLVNVPDNLIIESRQHRRTDDPLKLESCDLSWKDLDAP
jgi:HicB_like antitoxin of bacterial toxin-antitoxin system